MYSLSKIVWTYKSISALRNNANHGVDIGLLHPDTLASIHIYRARLTPLARNGVGQHRAPARFIYPVCTLLCTRNRGSLWSMSFVIERTR